MLGIVLANNFVMMFIAWELVGVSSYLLIGFWFEKPSARRRCEKGVYHQSLGGLRFPAGILMVWAPFGSLQFRRDAILAGGQCRRVGRDAPQWPAC